MRDGSVRQGWFRTIPFCGLRRVQGPLFAFSAYLGAVVAPAGAALLWSAVALIFIFLPVCADRLPRPSGMAWPSPCGPSGIGRNQTAVVGVFGAALYNPIWLSAVAKAVTSQLLWSAFCCSNVGVCRRLPREAVDCLRYLEGRLWGTLSRSRRLR